MARPAILAALPDEPDEPKASVAPPQTPHELQAAVEGVPVGDRVTFMGEEYRIASAIGLMPLIRFARAARAGVTTDDFEGLAAIGDMLEDCIDPADWGRFMDDATTKKADAEDLLEVVSQTIELLTARPTQRPSDSSDGPLTVLEKLTASSPSPDTEDGADQLIRVKDLMQQAGA